MNKVQEEKTAANEHDAVRGGMAPSAVDGLHLASRVNILLLNC